MNIGIFCPKWDKMGQKRVRHRPTLKDDCYQMIHPQIKAPANQVSA